VFGEITANICAEVRDVGAWIYASQLCFVRRKVVRETEAALVIKCDESTVERGVIGDRQEQAVRWIQALLVIRATPRLDVRSAKKLWP